MNPQATELSKAEHLELWREAMAQLRYLNDEVWKRFQFFVWVEFVLLLLAGGSMARNAAIPTFTFLLIGLFVGIAARYILRRNRVYYLQMLAKKTLLDDALGLHSVQFESTQVDHAFPWRLGPEGVQKIKADHDGWIEGSVRPKGTIARLLFWILEIFILLNVVALISAILLALAPVTPGVPVQPARPFFSAASTEQFFFR
jgi:hypothetical protein